MASNTVSFTVKTAVLLLVLAGVGATVLSPSWGDGTMLVFGWAVAWSLILGVIGYRTLRAAMWSTTQTDIMKNLMGGLFLRFVLIIGSHALLGWQAGWDWCQRAIMATIGLYTFALGMEIFTLQRELKARGAANASPAGVE